MDKYQKILQQYWGYDDFRGIQRDIIESIGAGRDTLGLMPTGGGKSITFQVPAMAMDGVCVVVTPLISLMKDQVDHLRQKGIRAAAVYSGMSHDEILQTLENAVYGGLKFLYVSPERLASDLFRAKFSHMKVSILTVDEAHCISQWGYDFRPSYLEIANIRRLAPDAPVLALTATATLQVVDDMQERLQFKEKNVFRMSFERANLSYVVRYAEDKLQQLVHILTHTQGSAIVYTRSRKRTKEMAQWLTANGLSAQFYHAGLEPAEKDKRQDEWQQDKTRIMVATNAFGMGIDKADVRLVIHMDLPSSLEAYFQEAGRAGRNGERAYAVLLYNRGDDRTMAKRIADTFPPKENIREVYEHLAYFYEIGVGSGAGATFEFDIEKFCRAFNHFPLHIDSALQILQRAGYLHYETDPNSRARLRFLFSREDLYRLPETSPDETAVINAVLRSYGGLFADYVYIDESLVGYEAGVDRKLVYLILKSLNHRGIVSFIPRRNVPLLTYLRDRVDGEDVVLDRAAYEDRKESLESRIQAILRYCKNDEVCRSRQLLRYFGDTKTRDCGHCDVCIAHRGQTDEGKLAPMMERILQLLDDGKRHHLKELHAMQLDEDLVIRALENLLDEERVRMDGSYMLKI